MYSYPMKERIKKTQYKYSVEFYFTIKKNETLSSAAEGMEGFLVNHISSSTCSLLYEEATNPAS